jgi:general secretion pathway protein I
VSRRLRSFGGGSPHPGGIGASTAAFSLLEVMVAVAILGLGLTVILTAQTGLFSSAKRAAQLSQAVGLARCKMSEIEVQLLKEGYQLTADNEEGPCCEDEDAKDMRCKWTIAPVMLPELAMGGGADAGAGMGMQGAGEGEASSSPLDSLSSTLDKTKADLGSGNTADAVGGLMGAMGGLNPGAGPSMGAGALAPMALSLVYPQLKGMLEASIRKVTVQVVWKDGSTDRDLTVVQYLTNPQQGGLLAEDESGVGGSGGASGVSGNGVGASRNPP